MKTKCNILLLRSCCTSEFLSILSLILTPSLCNKPLSLSLSLRGTNHLVERCGEGLAEFFLYEKKLKVTESIGGCGGQAGSVNVLSFILMIKAHSSIDTLKIFGAEYKYKRPNYA